VLSPSRAWALALAGWVSAAAAEPASADLCTPPQRVMFHCTLGAKSVSLCAGMEGERIASLAFRYGVPGQIEMSYTADAAQGRHFSATAGPLAPRASVRQLWFTHGDSTWLLSQCVGGDCPQSARLSVLQGERIVSNQRCLRSDDDRAGFARALVRFGGDASESRSNTGLVVIEDVDHGIERLYPAR
jgi:hypothetical protein